MTALPMPEAHCPQGWPIDPETGQREGPCGLIGCCARPGPADHDRIPDSDPEETDRD